MTKQEIIKQVFKKYQTKEIVDNFTNKTHQVLLYSQFEEAVEELLEEQRKACMRIFSELDMEHAIKVSKRIFNAEIGE